MTEATANGTIATLGSDTVAARRRRRYAADLRLRIYGITAIAAAIGLLGTLLVTLFIGGYQAFVQTHARIDFPISTEYVDPADPAKGNWRAVVRDGMMALFPEASTPAETRDIPKILTNNTQFFANHSKNHIGVPLRQKPVFLNSGTQPSTKPIAAGNANQCLLGLINIFAP